MKYIKELKFQKFIGTDLKGQDLSHTQFLCCDFTDADMSGCDASYSDFTGSKLVRTKCTNTNFAHTCLACRFEPRDAYGVTWTLDCKTFTGMTISKLWWFSHLHFSMLMKPELDKGVDPRDKLKEVFGGRYERMKLMFKTRQI